jgi:hypothetical protein
MLFEFQQFSHQYHFPLQWIQPSIQLCSLSLVSQIYEFFFFFNLKFQSLFHIIFKIVNICNIILWIKYNILCKNAVTVTLKYILVVKYRLIFSFIHMCIQWLGHYSPPWSAPLLSPNPLPFPPPPPSHSHPSLPSRYYFALISVRVS